MSPPIGICQRICDKSVKWKARAISANRWTIRATGTSCASHRRGTLVHWHHACLAIGMARMDAPIIAFSPEPSVADFLKRIVEDAGFVATAVWSSIEDLENAVIQVRPSALVYEVGIPFAQKWESFLATVSRPAFAGIPMVIATAASAEQCRRAGAAATLEILPRPTRDEVTEAIRGAVKTTQTIHTPAA